MITIEHYKEKYADLPFEAIIKTDLLRLGISFSEEALQICQSAKPKSYFIFSFDRTAQKNLSEHEKKSAPEEIALIGGPYDFKRTIVSVRVNPESPYKIDLEVNLRNRSDLHRESGQGKTGEFPLQLFFQEEKICDILLPPYPSYYRTPLQNGKPVSDITPTIEWGYLVYITAFRLCQYFGAEEECAFCDINHNYRQQKAEGRSYTGIKSLEEVLESLHIINTQDTEKQSHAYTVTGGSITSQLNGMNEAQFYAQYAQAIESKFPGRWIGKAVVQGLPDDEITILKDSGYKIYHPNYEVWDENIFNHVCPGKTRYVGQKEWIRRILAGAKIFGPEKVIPNFVAGIEMAKPFGFTNIEIAIRSTQAGLDFFMSQGICPRFTVWCVEPHTTLAKTNSEPPALDYYLRLLQVYRDTFYKYKLLIPPGYGDAGLGKAVFSVSAFMDVL